MLFLVSLIILSEHFIKSSKYGLVFLSNYSVNKHCGGVVLIVGGSLDGVIFSLGLYRVFLEGDIMRG